MQIPAFSPNLLIITILVVSALYGLLGGKHRLRLLILSVYVGIVLAEQMASIVKPYLGMLSAGQVNLVLLGLPILIFGLIPQRSHKGKSHEKGSAIANLLVGLLTGGLVVASALRLLPTSEMASVDGDSFIAMILQQYQLWLLGGLPLVAVIMGAFKAKEREHH